MAVNIGERQDTLSSTLSWWDREASTRSKTTGITIDQNCNQIHVRIPTLSLGSHPAMSASTPHRRLNPLLNSYVLCSPQRTARPWLGALEAQVTEKGLSYDPNCFLCPRNLRIGGQRNEDYQTTFVFPVRTPFTPLN